MNAEEIVALVRRRIESRYRRLVFVHEELLRLNASAKEKQQTKGVGSFEDFVFSRINFALYKKVDAEEFNLLFCGGLDDYEDSFFEKTFSMNREEIKKTIHEAYIKADSFCLCKKSSPLLLSIMRTVHTSLDFAPVLGSTDIPDNEQIKAVAGILDGLVIRHDDGMETKLFIPKAGEKNPSIKGEPLLCGLFHPLGKACTITLL